MVITCYPSISTPKQTFVNGNNPELMMAANNSALSILQDINNSTVSTTCSHGIVFPLLNEEGWSLGLRATLYFIALLYLFLGCAVVNEYVMMSTSIITSITKRIYLSKPPDSRGLQEVDGGMDVIEVRVWQDTIIHLSFMAFSTSATEIFLCTTELIVKHFDHGELGPGVIVGSAAFNMLIITSICMVSLPGNETRTIKKLRVYYVSMSFSLAGYAWILVLLYYVSPEVITLWESILTVLMFPVFIFLVWLSHHDLWAYCCSKVFHRVKREVHHKSVDEKKELDEDLLKDGKIDRENLARLVHKLKRHSGLTDHDAATIAAFKLLQNQPHSILWYRIGGIRSLTAGYRTTPRLEARLQHAYKESCETRKSECFDGAKTSRSTKWSTPPSYQGSIHHSSFASTGDTATTVTISLHNPNSSVVEFHSAIVAVQKTVGNIEVTISRYGNLAVQAKVRLTTIDGTAKKNRDYLPIDQILVFEHGQCEAHIQVVIINASGWVEDEEFFLRLSLIHNEHDNVELGRIYMMAVTIIDGDKESIVTFEKRGQIVKESAGHVAVLVNRYEGAAKLVRVQWRTVDRTAVSGKDYMADTGELVFNPGEMSLYIEIPIIDHMADQKDIYFEIELFAPLGGARLGRINRCTVTITDDDDWHSLIGTMASITTINLDAIRVQKSTWAQQMRDALLVDGGNFDKATRLDYVAHFFSFLWKALFSLIPPPTMLGGWPCFLLSLVSLAFMTLLIADVAKIFGCLIRMDDAVTGISFVALGTSLPRIFCARKETRMEKTADVCMIGTAAKIAANMTLGLGLGWLIAVAYHEVQGGAFKITDPYLSKNMAIFWVCAVICQAILIIRRLTPLFGKAEIGGPPAWKWITFSIFVILWISYLTLTHYFMHGHITPFE